MITYTELIEKKQPDYIITISNQKDTRKAYDILKKNKIKFNDESSNRFVFKKESCWDDAMTVLDDYDIEFDFSG